MRLIVANCSIDYSGRLTTHLARPTRLLMVKADGRSWCWSDHGSQSVKPLNWMTPPTVIEESRRDRLIVRKHAGESEDRLEIESARGAVGRHPRDGLARRGRRARQGRRRGAPAGAAGRAAALVRRRLPAGAARVADRHRPGRSDVPGHGGQLDRGRDQAGRRDRGGRAADAIPGADPARSGVRRDAAACWPRSRSSRRRGCSPRHAGSAASRSTSRCCEASASRT